MLGVLFAKKSGKLPKRDRMDSFCVELDKKEKILAVNIAVLVKISLIF